MDGELKKALDELTARVDALEPRADAAEIVAATLIGLLTEDQRTALAATLERYQRRVRAEAPRAGQDWPEPHARALNLATDAMTAVLLGEDQADIWG